MHIIFPVLVFLVPQALSFTFAFRDNTGCRGNIVEALIGGPNLGCRKPGPGALSAEIASTGAIDNPFVIVFFASDDCRPDTEVGHVDYLDGEFGCFVAPPVTPNFLSYEVWDVYA